MCRACVEKYHQMDPKLETIMDSLTEEYIALIDKVITQLPSDIINTGGIDIKTGQPFSFTDPKPDDISDEAWAEMLRLDKNMRRGMVATMIAGYMGFRYLPAAKEDPQEEIALYEGCETMFTQGVQIAHIIREATHILRGQAN